MLRNIKKIIFVLLVILILYVFSADIKYLYGNYDTPFIIVGLAYFLLNLIYKNTFRYIFIILLITILLLGISYIFTGSSRLTERYAEWFFLMMGVGIIQYGINVFKSKQTEL